MNWAKGRATRGRGTSFKGALQYVLHDKEASTAERVAHVELLNLAENDPHRAWREMKALCDAAPALKEAAGVKAVGRKLEKPVYAFTLNWHADDKPDRPHMLATARDALAMLGLSHHQAVIVEHSDTAHRHVHIIVNLVDPDTGKTASLSNDDHKLDRWADSYELRQGVIRSPGRRAKFDALDHGLKPPKREKQASTREEWKATHDRDQVALAAARALRAAIAAEMAQLKSSQKETHQARRSESATLWQDYRAARAAVRARPESDAKAPSPPRTPRQILEALTAMQSTFTRRDVARLLNEHTGGAAQFQAALARIDISPDLVRLGKGADGLERYTSRDMQAVERRMLDHAITLHERHGHGAAASLRAPAVAHGMATLSAEQQDAVRHVIGKEGIACVVGYAGSGKSTMLKAARHAWESQGFHVRGAALQALAAEGLQQGAGIESRTLHSLLFKLDKGTESLTARDVLVIDEAGMIGSRQMERLLGHVRAAGAKVVLVGDYNQLQSIEAGAAFRAIVDRVGAAEIKDIRRQKAEWQRQATRDLAQGNADAALNRYEAAGMVHGHAIKEDAKDCLIEAWARHRKDRPRDSQIILAYLRADVRDLNERARAARRQAGELGPDRMLKTAQGKRAFATGDRLYFLKNDTRLGVRNGTLGTIEAMDGQHVTVRLDGANGGHITFNLADYADIDHGYAATVHKSQGVTVDRTHVLATRHMDRHAGYVALSRHRDRVDVHWSADSLGNATRLASAFSRDRAKDVTLDYEPGDKRRSVLDIDPGEGGPMAAARGRHAELEALAAAYARDRAAMKRRHDAAIKAERASWFTLAAERARRWAEYARVYPRRAAPRRTELARTFEQAEAVKAAPAQAPSPPPPDPPQEPETKLRTGWKARRTAAERRQDGSYKPRLHR